MIVYVFKDNIATDSDAMQDHVSTETRPASDEITTETTTIDEDSTMDMGYDYQYSDIEFLAPYNEETSEYEPIVFDNTPYLSSEVANADINDVYTMVLSIRNVVLLWFLLWTVFKARTMIHSVLERVYERRSKK